METLLFVCVGSETLTWSRCTTKAIFGKSLKHKAWSQTKIIYCPNPETVIPLTKSESNDYYFYSTSYDLFGIFIWIALFALRLVLQTFWKDYPGYPYWKNPGSRFPIFQTAVRSKTWKSTWHTDQMWGTWGTRIFDAFVWAYGMTLTTGCLSSIKRLKSAERTLYVLLFHVLHCVSVSPCCSLSALILFFLSAITAHEGPLWAPEAWDHSAYHNKEKTSHICKWAPASWTGFLNKLFSRGKGSLLFWVPSAKQCGLRARCVIQSNLITLSQYFKGWSRHHPLSSLMQVLCVYLQIFSKWDPEDFFHHQLLWDAGDLLIITLTCFLSKFFLGGYFLLVFPSWELISQSAKCLTLSLYTTI